MPLWLTRETDGETQRVPADEAVVALDGLCVTQAIVRHAEVVLLDADGRESIQVYRGSHPGAGMGVCFGAHVIIKETDVLHG